MKYPILTQTFLMAAAVCSVGLCGVFPGHAQALSVEDYCDIKKSAPQRIKDIRPMAGGQEYAAISDDGRSIETFSYKTGKKTGVLFSLDGVKGDVKMSDFAGYTLSANG